MKLSDEKIRSILRHCQPETGPALSMALTEVLAGKDKDDTPWVMEAADKIARSGEYLASGKFEQGFMYLVEAINVRISYRDIAASVYRTVALMHEFEYPSDDLKWVPKNLFRSLIVNGTVSLRITLRDDANDAELSPTNEDRTRMWYDAIERRPVDSKEIWQLRHFGWDAEGFEAAYLLRREAERTNTDAVYAKPGNPTEEAAYTAAILHLQRVATGAGEHRRAASPGL